MATYAIGDIQGCYDELQLLLSKIHFDDVRDQLWLVGDLVNRGKQSLAVLRFLKQLKKVPIIVLGNHDLHFLSVAYGVNSLRSDDTFQDVLNAKDCLALCDWLRQQNILYYDSNVDVVMTHAGIPPQWNLQQAQAYAHELERVLNSKQHLQFYRHMYGNTPDLWSDDLEGWERLRLITNYFTRMRFCDGEGRLILTSETALDSQPSIYFPWFAVPKRILTQQTMIFGHWAALGGKVPNEHIYALDTGCVWGRSLTALRLEDKKVFSVKSLQAKSSK